MLSLCSASDVTSVVQLTSRSFYIEYHMGVCWARQSLTESTPLLKAMNGWLKKKPTMLNILPKVVSCVDYDPYHLLLSVSSVRVNYPTYQICS